MSGQVGIPVEFVAGLLSGALAVALIALAWRRLRPALARLRYLLAAGLATGFAIAAGVMYLAIAAHSGSAAGGAAAASAPGSPAAGPAAPPPAARSMELEVSALAARLARAGGTESDWTLLAQAYDFLGRPEDARRARAHIATAVATPVSQMSAATLAAAATASAAPAAAVALPGAATPSAPQQDGVSRGELERRVGSHPGDASAWLELAELCRTQHDYAGARAAYVKVAALRAMTAQSWADYADVLGSLAGGSLTAEAGTAIDSALRLDAGNPKALWLKASQAHEQHDDAAALVWWRRLRAVLPPGSPDAQIIDANISEAESLARGTPPPAATSGAAPGTAAAAQVSGTVSLDARFSSRVPPQATLFIYAKAADSPGPPLAVLRLAASGWPVSFHLDDSMAMLPSRRLSQFDKVIVEARISRSGQAAPASGDLYVTSAVVRPLAGESLALIINREIS
jgi:cytochrome c-type biogenesis protein CcmH